MRISTYLVESPFRKNPSRTQSATRTPSIKSNIFLTGLSIISFSGHLSETLGNKLKKMAHFFDLAIHFHLGHTQQKTVDFHSFRKLLCCNFN